jgi:hypothetical protein
VQPLGLAANAEAGFIHACPGEGGMLDRCRCHVVAHGIGKIYKAMRTILADPGDGRGDQLDAEQISHQRGKALFRQQLIVQQRLHKRADPFAILHRRSHPFGECCPRLMSQMMQRQSCARCLVTIIGVGSARSNTCRATWPVAMAAVSGSPHAVHDTG